MDSLPLLPPRPRDAHKGQFGRVLVVGGSPGMAGAPALAALSALRSGSGLVQVTCPPEIRTAVAAIVPCATIGHPSQSDDFRPTVRAVGPGCGDQLSSGDLTLILKDTTTPVVLDADGLNVLAGIEEWWSLICESVVITPHPGEMGRLLQSTPLQGVRLGRELLAREVAKLCGGVVVLKGHGTVVAHGKRCYVNQTGNPGMATGGSGDVLTGVIAALLGQGMTPYEAACAGVHIHGLAGDLASRDKGEVCMIATDIIDRLPKAFSAYLSGHQAN